MATSPLGTSFSGFVGKGGKNKSDLFLFPPPGGGFKVAGARFFLFSDHNVCISFLSVVSAGLLRQCRLTAAKSATADAKAKPTKFPLLRTSPLLFLSSLFCPRHISCFRSPAHIACECSQRKMTALVILALIQPSVDVQPFFPVA